MLQSSVNPATTLVEVSQLINPEILIEIEVDAIVTDAKQNKLAMIYFCN